MSKEFVQELDQALHDNSNFRAIKKKNDILEIRFKKDYKPNNLSNMVATVQLRKINGIYNGIENVTIDDNSHNMYEDGGYNEKMNVPTTTDSQNDLREFSKVLNLLADYMNDWYAKIKQKTN